MWGNPNTKQKLVTPLQEIKGHEPHLVKKKTQNNKVNYCNLQLKENWLSSSSSPPLQQPPNGLSKCKTLSYKNKLLTKAWKIIILNN